MDKDTPIIPRGYTEQTIANNILNKVSQKYAGEYGLLNMELMKLHKKKLPTDEVSARSKELQAKIQAEADEWIRREILEYRKSTQSSSGCPALARIEELLSVIGDLERRIDELEGRIDDLESQISDVEDTPSQLEELAERVTEAENKLEEIESKIDELED